MSILQDLRALTDEERIEAQDRARQIVTLSAGEKPTRDKFDHYGVSHYPEWFTRLIGALMAVVLVAAAMPSLFRLFTAGRDYFLHGIDNHFLAAIVGISTFLLAEFLIILSTISARVYFTGRARLVFVVPIVLGLAMALVGNWTVAKPTDLFGWLETLVPPLAVLFIALIGERLVLDAIESKHANERAYQEALVSWQAATAQPERSPKYTAAYANALKAALIASNGKNRGGTERRELMATLTNAHWRALVDRELKADEWYTEPHEAVIVNPTLHHELREPAPEFVKMNGNGNH
jgi:hypothetical protein